MASGMQTVIYPVKDLESAKTTMKRVLTGFAPGWSEVMDIACNAA
jgi:hypothetical protein